MQNDDTTDSIVPVTHAAFAHVDSTEASRTLEAVASQAAKELGAVLAIGDALTASDLPIIRRRLDEVIQATNAAIQACEQQQLAQE
ncbi:hypothetical protein [Pseudomonas viridiflava]|uniref:hypothetical protein n=1 Tax=Pseudomonas viridiflava TaxID=33069 RepID=UPI000F039EDA|nr:hypothetical protein [Pseudomonas viridiflava]